jgi:hypothetical protein
MPSVQLGCILTLEQAGLMLSPPGSGVERQAAHKSGGCGGHSQPAQIRPEKISR